jgi:transposase-like protein
MRREWQNTMERICPECGKQFVPAPEHAYVEDGKPFCRWNCICAYRKRNAKAKNSALKDGRKYTKEFKTEAVRKVVEDGRYISELCEELGVDYSTLFRWVHSYKEWSENK